MRFIQCARETAPQNALKVTNRYYVSLTGTIKWDLPGFAGFYRVIAGMSETHVLSALKAKHGHVKGQIVALDAQATQLRIDLDHIEHVIRMFQQDWRANDAAVAPRKPSRWDKRGQGIKTALEVLREAREPMTAREIVLAVWARTGLPIPSKQELYRITSTFNSALGRRVGKGVVMIEGRPKRWMVSR